MFVQLASYFESLEGFKVVKWLVEAPEALLSRWVQVCAAMPAFDSLTPSLSPWFSLARSCDLSSRIIATSRGNDNSDFSVIDTANLAEGTIYPHLDRR